MPTPIPGPKGWPLLGVLPEASKDVLGYSVGLLKYGDVVRVPLPVGDTVYLFHPDHRAHVLIGNHKNYPKGRRAERAGLLLGRGLLLSEGEDWRRQRTRMAPSFAPRHVLGFAPEMSGQVQALLATFGPSEQRDVVADMMSLTLKIAMRVLFGAAPAQDVATITHSFEEIIAYFSSVTGGTFPLPLWMPTAINRRFKKAMGDMNAIITRMIAERRAATDLGQDLLGLLLAGKDDDGTAMDDALVADEIRGLLLAGHETTALALVYTLWLLAGHPEQQEAVAAEAAAAPLTATTPLPRAEAALKEAMRLYPPVPFTLREARTDDTLGDYTIPAGTAIGLFMYVFHRDPRYFPEPERFWPERWTPAYEASLPRCAYLPFGAGPRVCIGMSMALLEGRLLLAEILRRTRVTRVDPALPPLGLTITLRPNGPVRLRFDAR